MRNNAWWILALGILYPNAAPAQPATHRAPAVAAISGDAEPVLAARLDELLAHAPDLAKARVGVAVVDVASGRLLYERAAREPFRVASVAKLITTGAALALLGPEHRFRTMLLADGWDGRGAVGNVYLQGAGDPALTTEALWKLVSDLRLAGVRHVTGQVIVDDSYFDGEVLPPAYDQKPEDGAFRAPVSAAALAASAVEVTVRPAKAGEPPLVVLDPQSSYFIVRNEASTVENGKTAMTIAAAEKGRQTEIVVAGTIRTDADEQRAAKRVWHPSLFAGETLRTALLAYGVEVDGKEAVTGVAPAAARLLAVYQSDPLGVLVRTLNKGSVNFMAEMLMKDIGAETAGAPGTSAKGLTTVRAWLADAGLAQGSYRLDNGSGLYDSTRFSPEQVVTVLRHAYRDFRYSADFVAALALAGADGTIGKRMVGGPAERYVRAKTGTLDGVSCLAGYAGGVGTTPLAFAVFVNDLPTTSPVVAKARGLEDEIAQALVLYLEQKTATR